MRKRIIISLFLPVVLLLSLSSCAKDRYDGLSVSGTMEIGISLSGMQTRTTTPGVDALNENTVASLSVFLWLSGEEDGDALFRADGLSVASGTARTYLPSDIISAVAASGEPASFAIVANAALPSLAGTAMDDVLSATISAGFSAGGVQSSIPMYGTGTVSPSLDGRSLRGSTVLRRSAAKLEARITSVAGDVEQGGVHWTPDTDHMQLALHRGRSTGPAGGYSCLGGTAGTQYNLTAGPLGAVRDGGGALLHYTTATPFYSFTADWSADESAAASFLLVVPWSSDGGSSWRMSYYQIPVNEAGMCIRDNVHYIINMQVGMVGSFEEETPVTLEPSIVIQGWGTVGMTGVEIKDSRYIVVGARSLILDNAEDCTIQYISSHDCTILSKSLTRPDLLDPDGAPVVIPETDYTLTIVDDETIAFHHDLDNSGTATADYAPFTLTFVIGHADGAPYSQEVTIVQRPMIYIVTQMNSDGDTSAHNGYVYVNNGTNSSYGGGASGLSGSNSNPAMYIITVSALSSGSSFTIGDPRTPYVNNFPDVNILGQVSYTWSASAPDLSGTTRRLSYYHPTESSERTVTMVAPQFRIASSYGACTTASYAAMQRRCATYQEDGYPAGRWRIPTKAEMQYILSLSSQGVIPELFTVSSGGAGYWCANGSVTGNASNEPVFTDNDFSGNRYVRCVYDEWFWGSEQIANISSFTWGDIDY